MRRGFDHCRSVWSDFDHVEPNEVLTRCTELGLPPSILVHSGHGVHAYWLLDAPFAVSEPESRERFEGMLKRFYLEVGADSTSDVTRLLRFPGFSNNKNLRNGVEPVSSSLLFCEKELRYSVTQFFDRWPELCRPELLTAPVSVDHTSPRTARRVEGLIRHLDKDIDDRSSRDFAVVCGLLRLKLTPEEIWPLVANHSKFAEKGRRYFETTIKNAVEQIQHEPFFD